MDRMNIEQELWYNAFIDRGWIAKYVGGRTLHVDFVVNGISVAVEPSSNPYRQKKNNVLKRPPLLAVLGKPLNATWWWYDGMRQIKIDDDPLPDETLQAYLIRHGIDPGPAAKSVGKNA